MPRITRARPSPALVVAVAALFVALSGIAVAAKKQAKNTVVSSSIAKNAVKSPDISNKNGVKAKDITEGAVGSEQILDGIIAPSDIAPDAIRSSHILDGVLGPTDIAAGAIRSSHILDGIVAPSDLSFGLEGSGTTSTAPTSPNPGGFATVATDTISPLRPGIALVSGGVEIADAPDQSSSNLVELRLLENGTPVGPTFSTTIADGDTETAAFPTSPCGVGAGNTTFSLQVKLGSAATVNDRSLAEAIIPIM